MTWYVLLLFGLIYTLTLSLILLSFAYGLRFRGNDKTWGKKESFIKNNL
jgi:hypothetical protein